MCLLQYFHKIAKIRKNLSYLANLSSAKRFADNSLVEENMVLHSSQALALETVPRFSFLSSIVSLDRKYVEVHGVRWQNKTRDNQGSIFAEHTLDPTCWYGAFESALLSVQCPNRADKAVLQRNYWSEA